MNVFSDRLKTYRQQNNLTQKDLADLVYVSDKTVSKWETGRSYPDIETLKSLALLFRVSIDVLIGSDEKSLVIAQKEKRDWLIYLPMTIILFVAVVINLVAVLLNADALIIFLINLIILIILAPLYITRRPVSKKKILSRWYDTINNPHDYDE